MNKKGNLDTYDRSKWIGIIGSREPTEEERVTAFKFAMEMTENGYIVVSGLAIGIDTASHQGALMSGQTVAIVNTPMSQAIYPKQNQQLAKDIVQNGCIIYPYNMTAFDDPNQKGLSQFSKRLIERDVALAWCCSKIVAVKNEESPITGGTRYACHYGMKMDKPVYRLDNEMKLHKNPEIAKAQIWWEPELNMDRFQEWMNYKLEGDYEEHDPRNSFE